MIVLGLQAAELLETFCPWIFVMSRTALRHLTLDLGPQTSDILL